MATSKTWKSFSSDCEEAWASEGYNCSGDACEASEWLRKYAQNASPKETKMQIASGAWSLRKEHLKQINERCGC